MRRILSLYYGLITHIDREIGRVLDTVKDAGLYGDTVIVFCTSRHPTSQGAPALSTATGGGTTPSAKATV
jgi:arylsulfatase A-like enzyme